MPNSNYYPATIDGRAHWWDNIGAQATAVLTPLGYTTAQITPIVNDAAWAIYCYGTIHRFFESVTKSLAAYESEILDGANGGALPALPIVPTLPGPPATAVLCGVEARRILWVQEIKKKPGYTASAGALLGIDTPVTPFDPTAYVCQLTAVASYGPHTVTGKFRKASGQVDGINLYGRKSGTASWTALGRFNATPFSASVPLAGAAPEEWEFYAMAVKKDVEFGQGSTISPVIVRA